MISTDESKKTNANQNWGVATLGDEHLFAIGTGGTPSTSQPQFWNGNIPWVTPTDLSNLGTAVISETARTITPEGVANSSAKPLPAGSVVLSTRAPIGYASILGQEMSINQGCKGIVIKDPKQVSNEYLYYNLLTQTQKMKELGSGSTFRELSQHNLKSIEVPLPEFAEQEKIASVLNTIQDLTIKHAKVEALYVELKHALIAKLFSEGLKNAATKDTEFGKLPSSWKVVSVNELINMKIISDVQDGNHGEKHPKNIDFVKSGVDFLTADCIRDGVVLSDKSKKLSADWLQRLRIGFAKNDDVLLTHKGTVGEASVLNGPSEVVILSPQVTYYRIADRNKLLPKFLMYTFYSYYYQQQLHGIADAQSTRAYVGITAQKGIKIVLPTKEEQEEIVSVLTAIDQTLALVRSSKNYYAELFDSLLYKLMAGKIRLKNIDVN